MKAIFAGSKAATNMFDNMFEDSQCCIRIAGLNKKTSGTEQEFRNALKALDNCNNVFNDIAIRHANPNLFEFTPYLMTAVH